MCTYGLEVARKLNRVLPIHQSSKNIESDLTFGWPIGLSLIGLKQNLYEREELDGEDPKQKKFCYYSHIKITSVGQMASFDGYMGHSGSNMMEVDEGSTRKHGREMEEAIPQ